MSSEEDTNKNTVELKNEDVSSSLVDEANDETLEKNNVKKSDNNTINIVDESKPTIVIDDGNSELEHTQTGAGDSDLKLEESEEMVDEDELSKMNEDTSDKVLNNEEDTVKEIEEDIVDKESVEDDMPEKTEDTVYKELIEDNMLEKTEPKVDKIVSDVNMSEQIIEGNSAKDCIMEESSLNASSEEKIDTKEAPKPSSPEAVTNSDSSSTIQSEIAKSLSAEAAAALNDPSAFRMQMSRENIEKMISEGTLEKVTDGYYKVKADTLQQLKITGKPLADPKTPLNASSSNTGPAAKKLKMSKDSSPQVPCNLSNIVTNTVCLPKVSGPVSFEASPSYIALMPVNQTPSNTNNAIIALPMQQNMPVTFSPTVQTYVALPQNTIASPSVSTQNITQTNTVPIPTSAVTTTSPQVKAADETPSLNVKSIESSSIQVKSVESSTHTRPNEAQTKSKVSKLPNASKTTTVQSSKKEPKTITSTQTPHSILRSTLETTLQNPLKRPRFETTQVKKPYQHSKPQSVRKQRKTTRLREFVSDMNSSDEEDEATCRDSKLLPGELASMFFKELDAPKPEDKSLLDKLHKAIFGNSSIASDEESDDTDNTSELLSEIKAKKSDYQLETCPGAGVLEAYVGPGKSSKLSIIRCQEYKQVKSFMYEVYKVRVTSSGREANTNILIPISEGYKFQVPSKPKEQEVEFTHIDHEDPTSMNYVSPLFLEKLARTELKLRKYKDEIKVLRRRYVELLQEYANRPQFSTLSDLVGASAKFLTEDQLVFYLMQLKAGAHNMQGIRYSVREKALGLAIYQKSPEVYRWLGKIFNLPSKRVLDQWLEDIGAQDPELLKKLMYHIYTTYNFKV